MRLHTLMLFSVISVFCNAQREPSGESFSDFQSRLVSDTVFQLDRVRFPIEGHYETFDTVVKWTRQNWPYLTEEYFKPDTTRYNLKNDQTDHVVFFGFYCKQCGYFDETTFKKTDGKWFIAGRVIADY